MVDLVRMSISMEPELYERLEALLDRSAAANRSEFLRDMIRDQLVAREWEDEDQEVLGTITYLYDHHARQLSKKLTELQHQDHDRILVTTHLHLSHHLCAEVVVARGTPAQIRAIAEGIREQKGVLHLALAMSTTGQQLTQAKAGQADAGQANAGHAKAGH